MTKISCVFLCGDRSPYGMAHLAPIARFFELKMIGVANEQCWAQFRRALVGGEVYQFRTLFRRSFEASEKFLRKPLNLLRERKHQRQLKSFGVPVIKLGNANSSLAIEQIRSYVPDVLLSAAYPQIFSDALIGIAPKGAINFHPSLLPRFRGAHPHYWCLAKDEKRSGVTAHYLTSRLDSGAIISQRAFDVAGLYYADLYKKLVEHTPALVEDVAKFLNDPNARPLPQDESLATVFRNDRDIHRRLDFVRMGSSELASLIRAGGAYALFRGKRIGLDRADVVSRNRHMTNGITVPAGVIVDIAEAGVVVATNDSAFLVIQTVRWSRKSQSFGKWVAKWDVKIGERLG